MIELLFQLGIPALLFVVGYFAGGFYEAKHFRSIRTREAQTVNFMVINYDWRDPAKTIEQSGLVTGSVVVSLDYFKRFLSGLRGIIGGRIKAFEPLMDRGRREALLRMKAEAKLKGYDAVINVRLETSSLASARADGKGTAGIEVLAFGTGVRYQSYER